jgi:hypothetical protein
MGDVHVAIVLLQQHVFPDLFSTRLGLGICAYEEKERDLPVDIHIAKLKFQDEVYQLCLDLTSGVLILSIVRRKNTQRVDRLTIHYEILSLVDVSSWVNVRNRINLSG